MNREEWRDFTKEVHENAVEHGFWENFNPDAAFALIHCEWSEAMEEYRRDHPMLYYVCEENGEPCREADCGHFCKDGSCNGNLKNHKPEGAAVELIDGCLRILDIAAWLNLEPEVLPNAGYCPPDFPTMIMNLHKWTCSAHDIYLDAMDCTVWMTMILTACFVYIRSQGLDPEMLMRMKHDFNRTRPYLHGKKC